MSESVSCSITVKGMQCSGCESTIETAVAKLSGVHTVDASHTAERVEVKFDPEKVGTGAIAAAIKDKGYEVQEVTVAASKTVSIPQTLKGGTITIHPVNPPASTGYRLRHILVFILLLVIVGGVVQWGRSLMPGVMQQLNADISYAMLFALGFLTGFHCIGMCGSFVVSYVDKTASTARTAMTHTAYGIGKTLSYTTIGGLFGLLGALVTITPVMRGYAALIAGVFLVLFGLKMLNLIPALRFFSLHFPKQLTRTVTAELGKPRRPFIIGLLNGLLLGCGPLQAMYIMAAGTGSPVEGAARLFFFGLGTLPPLLGFGFFASFLSRKAISEIVRVSGVLVIFMGGMMLNRGLMLI
jgi:copper ion binding protein